jgi:predicted Fe-S protein YdhL (DUF1289 family)
MDNAHQITPTQPIIDLTFSDDGDASDDGGDADALPTPEIIHSHSQAVTALENISMHTKQSLPGPRNRLAYALPATQPSQDRSPPRHFPGPMLNQPTHTRSVRGLELNGVMGDYLLHDAGNIPNLLHIIDQAAEPTLQPVAQPPQYRTEAIFTQSMSDQQQHPSMIIPDPELDTESKESCIATLMMVFPGICSNHVTELYAKIGKSSDQIIAHILDQIEKGIQYPTAKDRQKGLKRKRELDEDEEIARKYGSVDRIIPNKIGGVRPYIRSILQQEFPLTPMSFIDATLIQSSFRLFSAYRVLEVAARTYDSIPAPYNKIKHPRKMNPLLSDPSVTRTLAEPSDPDHEKIEVLKELQAARRVKRKADLAREAERQKELDEAENIKKAEAEGTMVECGCCYCDYPLNRMVHCDSEEMHWFCLGCAKMTAEVEIGKSKYELRCMSTDKCDAGFTMDQRYVV